MRRIVLVALLMLLPSAALAVPWFDQGWAEQLVAKEFPDYWTWINEVKTRDDQRYLDLLHQGRAMALQREIIPEVVEAWETRFHAQQHYRDTLAQWAAAPDNQTDTMRLALVSAAEDVHLANLELYDARLAWNEATIARLQLMIAEHELNYDIMAIESVERAIGPAYQD